MNITVMDTPDTPRHGTSATLPSPIASVFSRGHTSRSSTSNSSIASSPIPRDSFDLYGSRLGKVTEEPQEIDELDGYTMVDRAGEAGTGDEYDQYFVSDKPQTILGGFAHYDDYNLGNANSIISPPSADRPQPKRQRSADNPASLSSNRFSRVSNSLSRRWRNRSGVAPQLSIITHISTPASRSGSNSSSQIVSPALSAVSRYESCLPSPVAATFDDSLYSIVVDIPHQPRLTQPEEQPQVTTPLLPPVFNEIAKEESPIHSPLQSPSIAPTQTVFGARTSMDTPAPTSLPSPPLSTQASLVSMRQRSRANTTTASPMVDIPPLQLIDEVSDPWTQSLGHANFNIHPEPYFPEHVDLASYTEFRTNWHQARTNYAKHLARTIEHNGATSKVSKLTEQKWSSVDSKWKNFNDSLTKILSPALKKLSDSDTDMQDSQTSAILEKPVSRIIMPEIDDKCGKFPELGDGDIVGPMTVGPPRNLTPTTKSPTLATPPGSPTSPRKRNFLRFFSDILKGN